MNHRDIHYTILLKCDIDTLEKMSQIFLLSHQIMHFKCFWYNKFKCDHLNLPMMHEPINIMEWIATYKLQNLLKYISEFKMSTKRINNPLFSFKSINDSKYYKPTNIKTLNDYYQIFFNKPYPSKTIYPSVQMIKFYGSYVYFYFDDYIDSHCYKLNLPVESELYQFFLTNVKEIDGFDLMKYI